MAFFNYIVSLSIKSLIIIPLVIAIRFLIEKYPKKYSYLLWIAVFISLVVKIDVQGTVNTPVSKAQHTMQQQYNSMLNSYTEDIEIYHENTEEYAQAVQQGIQPILSEEAQYVITAKDTYAPPATVQSSYMPKVQIVWLGGIMLLLSVYIKNIIDIISAVKFSVYYKDNIYYSENIKSPFVFGVIKPKIYLPYSITPQQEAAVIAHEKVHIKRLDYIVKPLCYFIIVLHWFNPLVWIAFYLLTKDMELSCDEAVVKSCDKQGKKDYCTALLQFALKDKNYKIGTLMFGESNSSSRIKNVLSFKQPQKIIAALLVVIVAAVSVVAVTSEKQPEETVIRQETEHSTETNTERDPVSHFTHDIETEDSLPLKTEYITVAPSYFKNCLFIGDSIADGLRVYDNIENSISEAAQYEVYNNITPDTFMNEKEDLSEKTSFEKVVEQSPKQIYILMGTDALAFQSASRFVADYADMVEQLKEKLPDTAIYLCSIPPVTEEQAEKRTNFNKLSIYNVNRELQILGTIDGIYYVNLHEILADSNGYLREDFAYADGIHLNPDIYTYIIDYLREHIVLKQNTAVDAEATNNNVIIGWPTAANVRITRGFTGQYPAHDGVDIAGAYGTEIYAAADGVVVAAEYTEVDDGIYVTIQHENGWLTHYAHCCGLYVEKGDKVIKEQLIARIGSTGNSTGNHLHFEIINENGISLDPYRYW